MKGFCTYACPYGWFFRLADTVAPARIRVTDACEQCGHCTATCTSNVLVHAEVKQYGMVVDPGCMKCMDCVSVCPKEALYFGWGRPAIGLSTGTKVPKNYSLTWPEEIAGALVFLGSLFAVRNVYGLVPFLMALGTAAVTTFLALKAWRLLTAREVYFHKYRLKSAGELQRTGWAFLVVAVTWVGLTAHSGFIRWQEHRGSQAFQQLQIPDELALAQPDPTRWLTPADKENIAAGAKHLRTAARFGLLQNGEGLAKLAWFEFLDGNAENALTLLERAAAHQRTDGKAVSLYYKGAILNRLGRHEQAQASIDRALAERDDLILARQEKGEALWQLGRKDEAIALWSEALQRNPRLVLAANQLAGAKRSLGRFGEAIGHEQQADRFAPADPLFHWMLALRLRNVGMSELAEKHFARAAQLDPSYQSAPR